MLQVRLNLYHFDECVADEKENVTRCIFLIPSSCQPVHSSTQKSDHAFHFQIEEKGAELMYRNVGGYGQCVDLQAFRLVQAVHDTLFFLAQVGEKFALYAFVFLLFR